jgi:hypothetical protein
MKNIKKINMINIDKISSDMLYLFWHRMKHKAYYNLDEDLNIDTRIKLSYDLIEARHTIYYQIINKLKK